MSCNWICCSPRIVSGWSQMFAYYPVPCNEGWTWFEWVWKRKIVLGGHGETRTISEYRIAL